jgi:hypothetical protein
MEQVNQVLKWNTESRFKTNRKEKRIFLDVTALKLSVIEFKRILL